MENLQFLDVNFIYESLKPKSVIDSLERYFRDSQNFESVLPPRGIYKLRQDRNDFGVVMPAFVNGVGFGVKIATVFPDNTLNGEKLIHGLVVLFDSESGRPRFITGASAVTNLRTGGICGLSTKLCTAQNISKLGVVGAGVQSRFAIQSILSVRDIKIVKIFSRTRSKCEELKNWISANYPGVDSVEISSDLEDFVKALDVICMTTSNGSDDPVLSNLDVDHVQHICSIGGRTLEAREVAQEIINKRVVLVDDIENASRESVEISSIDINSTKLIGLSDALRGRKDFTKINTYFRSVGVPIQDVAIYDLINLTIEQEVRSDGD